MSMTNGHTEPVGNDILKPSAQPHRRESELSNMDDFPTAAIASPDGANDGMFSDDDAVHDMATSELDEDDDAPGEEDADFDMESPPPRQVDAMDHDRSSSESSSRPGKRKADVDDEEYMKQNPELYGLRRSVQSPPSLPYSSLLLTRRD